MTVYGALGGAGAAGRDEAENARQIIFLPRREQQPMYFSKICDPSDWGPGLSIEATFDPDAKPHKKKRRKP